uniref:Uncharacterized protein n=1 Tax=Ficedula albicollis TaxID=59894 RepID=A0A803WCM2_FICAL
MLQAAGECPEDAPGHGEDAAGCREDAHGLSGCSGCRGHAQGCSDDARGHGEDANGSTGDAQGCAGCCGLRGDAQGCSEDASRRRYKPAGLGRGAAVAGVPGAGHSPARSLPCTMARGQLSRGTWGALVLLGLMLPAAPAGAWYKHVASPRYHTVGQRFPWGVHGAGSPVMLGCSQHGPPAQDPSPAPRGSAGLLGLPRGWLHWSRHPAEIHRGF